MFGNSLDCSLQSEVYCFRKVSDTFTAVFNTYIPVLRYNSLQKLLNFQVSVDDFKVSLVCVREMSVL